MSSKSKTGSITLVDIAKHAGVSRTTASRVINRDKAVKRSTREKVEASVRALNFTPNIAARNLASARTIRVCILAASRPSLYFGELLMGALKSANELGAYLVVENSDVTSSPQGFSQKFRTEWDSLIVSPAFSGARWLRTLVEKEKFPAVFIGSAAKPAYGANIVIDDFHAARDAVLALIARGHERIGFIKGHPNYSSSDDRYKGYCQALYDHGIPLNLDYVEQGFYTYRSGMDAAIQLLGQKDRPTAIFASNDDMAAGVIGAAGMHGLAIPRNLSVVGFDDSLLATTVWPNLTTVNQPITQMGMEAVRASHSLATGQFSASDTLVLPYELVERDSVATPLT